MTDETWNETGGSGVLADVQSPRQLGGTGLIQFSDIRRGP
jgi:hypothetical protein